MQFAFMNGQFQSLFTTFYQTTLSKMFMFAKAMVLVCKQTDETCNIDFKLFLHCLYLYGKGQGCNKLLYMCLTFQWSVNLTTDCFSLV